MTWLFILALFFLVGVAALALAYLQDEETARRRVRFVPKSAHGVLDPFLDIGVVEVDLALVTRTEEPASAKHAPSTTRKQRERE